ncbi:MAG: SDR family NAD(P)-dependent oxidoreductase, partial [Pseudomonadales bacterium]|nr:SDR family NAD(P)-dependent oxidoreductase [Pseudomonadales bacterium]
MNTHTSTDFELNKLFSVEGKVVMITGGSSGLGLAMAAGFASNGAKVVIASRSQERCDEAVSYISDSGTASAVAADVSTPEGRQKIVDSIQAEYGELQVLINNAGTNFAAALEDYTDEAFAKVINTNVNAVFSLTRDLTPLLSKGATAENPSRVINIGSMDGIHVPIVQRVPTFAYSS